MLTKQRGLVVIGLDNVSVYVGIGSVRQVAAAAGVATPSTIKNRGMRHLPRAGRISCRVCVMHLVKVDENDLV